MLIWIIWSFCLPKYVYAALVPYYKEFMDFPIIRDYIYIDEQPCAAFVGFVGQFFYSEETK